MTCPFAHDDAALRARRPVPRGERLDFERHLPGCDELHPRGPASSPGSPGLLGRVDASVLEHAARRRAGARTAAARPVPRGTPRPAPAHPRRGRAGRRRGRGRVGVACAAGRRRRRPVTPRRRRPSPAAPRLAVRGRADGPGRATSPCGRASSLEQVTWGTRLGLTCTYDPDSVEYELPADGRLHAVRADPRRAAPSRWAAGARSAARRCGSRPRPPRTAADIASVEVRTTTDAWSCDCAA